MILLTFFMQRSLNPLFAFHKNVMNLHLFWSNQYRGNNAANALKVDPQHLTYAKQDFGFAAHFSCLVS